MTAPLRADAERNRQRLLAAAKDLFATRGLDVTLDDVARHAGVGTGTAYRRFPNKDALIDALMADRIGELAEIARECLEEPDRGLKEVLFSSGRGRERSNHARRAIAPVVTKLVARARDAGVVRSDFDTSDVPLINFMLNTIVDFSRGIEPELYKRYLAIVLDGMRPRDDLEPLPVEALGVREFQDAMARWKP